MANEASFVRLSDLCDPDRDITYGIVKVGDYVKDGVPVIRGGDIRGGRIVFDEAKRVTNDVSLQFRRTILKGGEILINLIAEPGHSAIVPPELAGANVSRDVAVIALNEEIDHKYVDYCLKSPMAVNWLNARLQGSVTQKINLTTLRDLPIPTPSRDEQRSIAYVLGTLDDKIELNRKMNETLEAMARALFKSWFVDFDPIRAKAEGRDAGLPDHIAALFPDSFQDSELGEIPTGWDTSSVYEIAEFANGAAYRDMHFSQENEGLPVIKIAELKSGVTSTTRFTTTELGDRYRIETNEILFSWSGNPDTSIDMFIWDGGPAWLNQHIFRVRENGKASRARIFSQLKALRPVFAEIARNKQTTGLGHVTIADMKQLMICEPSSEVAVAFDKFASPLLAQILSNQLQIRSLLTLRYILLPKLISGEIRLGQKEERA